jgi:phosphate transport system substrate-binding protein
MKIGIQITLSALLVLGFAATGCKPKETAGSGRITIQNKGSDTLVNVAQAWAEAYKKVDANVNVEVSGGGSGVGIAALIKGTVELANSSRDMKPKEMEDAKKSTGKDPKEFTVGYDALAVYVHKDNPLDNITTEQLAQLFMEGGKISKWSELGVTIPGGGEEIVRVSRQSSSGTYEFFREHVLKNKDFRLGSRDMNGSKEVVELVGSTKTAIGYSGMGYATTHVKMLKVDGVAPSVETTMKKTYPIARSLHVYTLGEPTGELAKYVQWLRTEAGQTIMEKSGYVPLAKDLWVK